MEEKENWYDPISDDEFDAGSVSRLSDRPNQSSAYGAGGLSAKDLKAWFDKSATLLKDKLNELLRSIKDGKMSDELKISLEDITSLSELCKAVTSGDLANVFSVPGETAGKLVTLAAALARIYELLSENQESVQAANQTLKDKVGFTDYATSEKAGAVKVSQGSSTNIGITGGLIKVLKATEEHIAARGANYTDYVLAASKTNAVVKAALTDENKMALSDDEKATARGTLGAASTEDVNGMRLELSMDEAFKLTVSLLNANNEVISVSNEIDLPLEEMVIGIDVNENEDGYILKLKTGETVPLSTEAIVRGLAKQEDLDELKEKIENQEVPKIEIAPTLDGNDPDKAPSVQAVNAELANALKCEKSGTSLALTDISPITHPLKVSVEGVEDLSAVKVKVFGKNLFDINSSDGFLTTSGGLSNEIIGNEIKVVCSAQRRSGNLKLGTFNAGTYYISITSNPSTTFHAFVGDRLGELTNAQLKLPSAITITKPTTIWAYTSFSNTVESYIISNIQVELGNTATEYVPYVEPIEYAVNADGTVDGIKSAYPSTVLMTNTTGAIINCEYNRDAARYADKVDGKLEMVSNTYTYHRVYAIKPDGTQTRLVAGTVVAADALVQRGADSQINVPTTPTGTNNATSRKYVDDTAAAIRAELGPQIELLEVEYTDVDGGFIVPDDVLPNACLTEAKLVVTDWTTGEETIAAPVSILFWSGDLYDPERKQLGELETSFDSDGCFYFEIPTGTKCIELNRAVSIDGNTEYGVASGKCVFQKEV